MATLDGQSIRYHDQQASLAISLAMEGKWQEAVNANKELIERFPHDVEAHNRLGRALMELGDYAGARQAYSRSLELDQHNTIARKNMERLSHLGDRQQAKKKTEHRKVSPEIFVKESGKAAVIALEQLAPAEVLARATTGEEVALNIAGERLLVQDERGDCLGRMEAKYERRLVRLMNGGNKYTAAISSVGENEIRILVKEVYRHPSQAGRHSFAPEAAKGFQPAVRKGMLRYELDDEEFEVTDEEVSDDRGDRMGDLGFHEVSAGG
jgi:tetratricopeptide (TPR) repeat protein